MQSSLPLHTTHAMTEALAPDVPPDLSVIIVNYNVREFLEQALRSVERAGAGLRVEIFVVDNNSADGSVEMVRSLFPDVQMIANEENVGFSKANNLAIRKARAPYLLILNPDTIVQEDTLVKLVQFMERHPEAGAAGCQILNPDGAFAPESRRSFPVPAVAFYRLVGLSRLFPRSRIFGRYNLTYLPKDEEAEVDALSGSCMLVRRSALYFSREEAESLQAAGKNPDELLARSGPCPGNHGAGLLDEDFFMYGEDLDWCFRIQQAGWKILYTPGTQIIHYKGESTKKGELRYVRLFYGAMLQFTQKHFQNRYSRIFALLLRYGIVARAALTLIRNAALRAIDPAFDFLLVFLVVTCVGLLRSAQANAELASLFYLSVAPAYALGTVLGIAAVGGYRFRRRRRIRPALLGVVFGLVLVAVLSFFVKEIAFSRVVVLVSFPFSILLLSLRRLAGQRRLEPKRALVIGHAAEARRLQRMLGKHPRPPFTLLGYVEPEEYHTLEVFSDLPRLGSLRHLRDLVRLRKIDDVVFAAGGLSNRVIFQLIHQLQDLPVQFKMLAEGSTHIIGKAAIEDLSLPSVIEMEGALIAPGSIAARRAFEIPVALLGVLLHPLIWLLDKTVRNNPFFYRLARRTRQMPEVLLGRRALIGYDPAQKPCPPAEWNLLPGVFAITDMLATAAPTSYEINQAYWFYIIHRSVSLDWDILLRSLRRLADPSLPPD